MIFPKIDFSSVVVSLSTLVAVSLSTMEWTMNDAGLSFLCSGQGSYWGRWWSVVPELYYLISAITSLNHSIVMGTAVGVFYTMSWTIWTSLFSPMAVETIIYLFIGHVRF